MPFRSKKSASEGDIAELLVDLPKQGFKIGQRGTVISAFLEPTEAYDLEIIDESGRPLGFAYSIRPDQFSNLSRDAFVRAMEAIENSDLSTAEMELRVAVDLRPDNIGAFINSIVTSFGDEDLKKGDKDISVLIPLLRLALRVRSDYEVARTNLAIAFLKFGVRRGNSEMHADACEAFLSALAIKTDEKTEGLIKTNLVLALTSLGQELFKAGDFESALNSFRSALLVIQDETTIRNVGLAYGIHGSFLMEAQNFDLAIQEFERAEDAGVIVTDFINCCGVCFAMKGEMRLAQETFERALGVDPSNVLARHNLTFLKTSLGAQKDFGKLRFTTGESASNTTTFGHGTFQSLVWRQADLADHETEAFR